MESSFIRKGRDGQSLPFLFKVYSVTLQYVSLQLLIAMSQHQGATVSNSNGVVVTTQSPVGLTKGTPIPAHDLSNLSNGLSNGIGANPRPGWSQCE